MNMLSRVDTEGTYSKITFEKDDGTVVDLNLYEKKSAIIRTAELPNTTITLSQNGTDIESKTTTGGVVDFSVSAIGTYTITATGTGITSWTKTIEVTELNTVNLVKAGALANYSEVQIHTACQGGYAHIMWSPKDTWTFPTIAGSVYSGAKIMIADFISQNGVDKIIWIASDRIGTTSYDIYPQFHYIANATTTFLSQSYQSLGGFKYSAMRQRMMESGEEIYSQATGVLPDDYAGTLTDGIKFSEFYYTDGNGTRSSIYSYDTSTDTFTVLSVPNYSNTPMFLKGYFTSVGAIDETTFNSGYYYTYYYAYGSGGYTRATTYVSGTTYYGFYETLQADGIFLAGLKLTGFADYLVKQQRYASAGSNQTTSLSSFTDYITLPAIEEITGLNRTMTLPSGQPVVDVNAYNLAGEGTKQAGFDFETQTTGKFCWSRSTNSNNSTTFGYIGSVGSVNNRSVYLTNAVRLSFITGPQTKYTLTGNITNGTLLAPANIVENETMTIRIRPNANYTYPNSITVSGATYTYDNTNGEITLSNATGNVTITAECESTTPAVNPYLTFRSPASFSISAPKNWDGTLEYSTDTTTWNTWNGTQVSSGSNNELYFRGIGNTVITDSMRWTFNTTDSLECIGNIENLLDYKTVLNGQHPAMADFCYGSMFYGCSSLTTAPELPATTLAEECYYAMFRYCTNLTTAPALPATTLAEECYSGMFGYCTNIKISDIQVAEYQNEYRIPYGSATGTDAMNATMDMFVGTGGTFKGTPTINTTYYTSNTVVLPDGTIIPGTE